MTPPSEPMDIAKIRALGRMIQKKRVAQRLTLEEAAKQSGVSTATLSRLERIGRTKSIPASGVIQPDLRTLAALARWLDRSLDEVLDEEAPQPSAVIPSPPIPEGATTPEIVEAYLRADRNLDPRTAAMLSQMFDLAYRQYSQLSGASSDQSDDADRTP